MNSTYWLVNQSLEPGNIQSGTPGYPQGIACLADGQFYVSVAAPREILAGLVPLGLTNGASVPIPWGSPGALTYVPSTRGLWVALPGISELSILDTATDQWYGNVTVGSDPVSLADAATDGLVYVANQYSGNLSIVNQSNGTIAGSVPVGGAPDALAFDSLQNEIFVGNQRTDNVTVLSASDGTIVRNLTVGYPVSALAFDPTLQELYVPSNAADFLNATVTDVNLTVVSTVNDSVLGIRQVPAGVRAMVYDNQSGDLYAALYSGTNVSVLSAAQWNVLANLTVGDIPSALAASPTSWVVLVVNSFSDDVGVILASTNEFDDAYPLAPTPGPTVYDAAGNWLVTVEESADAVDIGHAPWGPWQTISVGVMPVAIAFSPDTGVAYVANYLSDSVTAINLTSFATSTVAVAPNPFALALDPANGKLFVAFEDSQNLSVVSTATNTTVGSVALADYPTSLAYDNRSDSLLVGGTYFPYTAPGRENPTSAGEYVGLTLVNASSDRSVANVSTNGTGFRTVAFDPEANLVLAVTGYYNANDSAALVDEFNATSLELQGVVQVETGSDGAPYLLTYLPGVNLLACFVEASSRLLEYTYETTFLSPVTSRTLGTAQVGDEPEGIVDVPGQSTLYVANEGGGTFSLIPTGNWSAPAASFPVTFSEVGLAPGTPWAVSEGANQWVGESTSLTFPLPNGTYTFSVASCTSGGCPGEYTPSPGSATLDVQGMPVGENITFLLPHYALRVTEVGLPTGTEWQVTLDGVPFKTNATFYQVLVANGSYSYSAVSLDPKYHPTTPAGNVTVHGLPVAFTVSFAETVYHVTVRETGLPTGTTWKFSIDATNYSTRSSSFGLTEPNGTYQWAVVAPAGFASVYNSTFEVAGTALELNVTFQPLFPLTFQALGLPADSDWSVRVDAQNLSGPTANLTVDVPNGSYLFTVVAPANFTPIPPNGTVVINGGANRETILFAGVRSARYDVTFDEQGLSPGINWSVAVDGLVQSTAGTNLTFIEPNGSYTFVIEPVPGYLSSLRGGSLVLDGHSVSESVQFTPGLGSTQGPSVWSSTDWSLLAIGVVALLAGTVWRVRRRPRSPPPSPTPPPASGPVAAGPARPAPNAEYWTERPPDPGATEPERTDFR